MFLDSLIQFSEKKLAPSFQEMMELYRGRRVPFAVVNVE